MYNLRNNVKAISGRTVAAVSPQCQFDHCIFVLAHMRCGSTALSNIMCSRPDISGYGEAHIKYDDRSALGRLVVNQALRHNWKPRAKFLFDKILHSRHDGAVDPDFFKSRAIFLARSPGASIKSIRALYTKQQRQEYESDYEATKYYIERLEALLALWHKFPAGNRVGLLHSDLLFDPESALLKISTALQINPVLENTYFSSAASRSGGAGDPETSGKFTKIVSRPFDEQAEKDAIAALEVSDEMRQEAIQLHQKFAAMISH